LRADDALRQTRRPKVLTSARNLSSARLTTPARCPRTLPAAMGYRADSGDVYLVLDEEGERSSLYFARPPMRSIRGREFGSAGHSLIFSTSSLSFPGCRPADRRRFFLAVALCLSGRDRQRPRPSPGHNDSSAARRRRRRGEPFGPRGFACRHHSLNMKAWSWLSGYIFRSAATGQDSTGCISSGGMPLNNLGLLCFGTDRPGRGAAP